MFRRLLVLLGLVATLTVASTGLSASDADPIVRVRVEGKTRTIFGPTQPRAEAATALGALEAASIAGEFYVHTRDDGFGPYVDQIGRHPAGGSSGWVFKVNGVSPPVGADKVQLRAGDVVLWYWATFTDVGGPRTLGLTALRPSAGCYRTSAVDDAGVVTSPGRITLHVDGRRVTGPGARTCVGKHRGLVRATAPGMVRSNALP